MNHSRRAGLLLLVFGSALAVAAAARTAAPAVVIEGYTPIGPGTLSSPNSSVLATLILPPQQIRIELSLSQGLGLDLQLWDCLRGALVLSLSNASQTTIIRQVPVRSLYNLTLSNPNNVSTLAWIRVTLYGVEWDVIVLAGFTTAVGLGLFAIKLVEKRLLPRLRKRVRDNPETSDLSIHRRERKPSSAHHQS
jgi:hypothetical protein